MMYIADKQTFIQLRAQGVTYSHIAEQLGKSKQTLIESLKHYRKNLKTD